MTNSTQTVVVAEYAEALLGGATQPAAMRFFDGAEFWPADDFHRYQACVATGDELLVTIWMGTRHRGAPPARSQHWPRPAPHQ